jgi:hypothetical protein
MSLAYNEDKHSADCINIIPVAFLAHGRQTERVT